MRRIVVSLLALCWLTVPAWAEEETPVEAQAEPEQAGLSGPTLHGQLALSLQEAIAMAIENNLDVDIVRYDPPIADLDATAARGAYDPNLYGNFDYASTETPIASALQSGSRLVERQVSGAAGFRGLIPKLGWSYDLGYTGNRLQTTSSVSSLSPEYRTGVKGSLTMPVLKGFLWNEPWVQVKLTRIGSVLALAQFRQSVMDIVLTVENAYWNLAARRQELGVANKSLETSNALLGQTEAQYDVGVVSKVEVTESEAGVADREFRQITADNQFRTAQDDLIDLVLGPHLTPISTLEVSTTDRAEDYVSFELDAEDSARTAFENRPELDVARQIVEQQEIRLKFAKNSRLPQLDLVAAYGYQGLAGRTNPSEPLFGGVTEPQELPIGTVGPASAGGLPVFGVQQVPVLDANGQRIPQQIQIGRDYRTTDDDFFSADGAKQWNAGAILTFPLGNRTARANATASHLELRKARTQLRRQEQVIVTEVRKAVRDLGSALKGIKAAERRRVAAQEQQRAEQIRLEHGESTPFDVLQREEDLVEAESQRIGALQVYHSSVAALDRAEGTILRDRNILVDDALPLR